MRNQIKREDAREQGEKKGKSEVLRPDRDSVAVGLTKSSVSGRLYHTSLMSLLQLAASCRAYSHSRPSRAPGPEILERNGCCLLPCLDLPTDISMRTGSNYTLHPYVARGATLAYPSTSPGASYIYGAASYITRVPWFDSRLLCSPNSHFVCNGLPFVSL